MKALIDNALSFHQSALNVQAQRQQMLASNIANADTPGYKARDVDFRSALQDAMGGRFGPLALATTSPRHLPTGAATPFEAYVGFRRETQSSVDGNTVNMDVERAAFAENAVHYEASVTFVNGMLRGMQTAISGQ
jgi:flagellar basal-body rod protein FlgB